jgi:uncharacterized membrane protein YqjE
MDWLARLESPQNALSVLTAMITPTVLVSACGALIFSTSTRLGRVVDRVRELSARFETLAKSPDADEMADDRRQLVFAQLDRYTSRARLIQRAMMAFYTALGLFITTSVVIAVVGAFWRNYTWVAVALGIVGGLFMLYGAVLLVIESRMAMGAIAAEMDFVWKVSQRYARGELDEARGGPATWLGKKIG